jgi:ligand-binding sensor domain-containing protein
MKNKGGIGIVSTNKIINEFIYIHDKINKNGYGISYTILSCQKSITDKNYIYEDSLPFNLYKNITCGSNGNSFYLKRHTYLTYNSCEDKLYYFSPHHKKEVLLSSININSIPLDKEVNIGIFPINDTEILINTGKECFVIDTNLQRVQKYDFLKEYATNRIETDKEDNRWIATRNDGLYLLTKESATTHTFMATEINQDIRALTADSKGRVFGGTAQGDIFYVKEINLQKISFIPPSKLNIRDMIVIKPNILVIAGENYQLFMPFTFIK